MESEEQEVEKLIIYNEIHRLRSEGFSNSAIARKLKISRNRVIEYGKMTPEQFHLFAISLQSRSKKLDPFQDKILDWLREHPDLSGAQVLDWLGDKLNVNSVAEGTVRNYVNELREVYHIPKGILVQFLNFLWGYRFKWILGRYGFLELMEYTSVYTSLGLCYLIQDINM